jgi:twitching motility protein PilT
MATLPELLQTLVENNGSDLHITTDTAPQIRVHGHLKPLDLPSLGPADTKQLAYSVLTDQQKKRFEEAQELDFSFGIRGIARFRCNVFNQRGAVAAVYRVIPEKIKAFNELGLPQVIATLSERPRGLVLVTGPTGSGKSTTLAAMIDKINTERREHILTIEDPIEYMHTHARAMINQREIGADTDCFRNALRAVLREDPDVILVGELRDLETIAAAITLAETGHLVLGTLHTRNAPQTIDRIVDVFPANQQDQIKVQLANCLEAVLAQQLLPRNGGGRIAAMETMIVTSGVRNLIREGKSEQLYSLVETGAQQGMQTMDRTLVDLFRQGVITRDVAAGASIDRDNFERLLRARSAGL